MMNPFKMIGGTVYQVLSIIFLFLYLFGLLNTYFSDKKDHCEMTYMFEYPQFVRIALPDNKKYPQYGLYVYAEGRMTEKARKMRFDGIPVLFLPGNSGSHMQGRSLASVALRKAQSDIYDYHFDYFTVSYNEDMSGLFGGVLNGETEFAAACIAKILSLYKDNAYTNTVPTSVVLIGHSMGGVIAKRLLAYLDTINMTNIAITLASPLESPVVNIDHYMLIYYRRIYEEWKAIDESVKNKKVMLSFGNGPRDYLIPAALTSSKDSDINALTTAIPGVWVSPDHVSIVWCKQFVMAINRFMFSIVDPQTKQLVQDKKVVLAKAKQYFQANRSMTLSPDIPRANAVMVPDAFWYEDNRRNYQISRPEITKMTYLMIRLVRFPQNRFVAVEAVNVDDRDWVFGCSAMFTHGTHRYCKQATSLAEMSRWTGAAKNSGKRKLATVHLHDVIEKEPSWTHIVYKVSPTKKPIVLNVDINDLASRQITVDLPYDIDYRKSTIKEETEPHSLYYELILPGLTKIYQAYFLYVEPTKGCQAKEYHVTAEVHVPWAEGHEYFHYFTHLKRTPMKLRLFKTNPKAMMYGADEPSEYVKVTLLLDPQCTYTISIQSSWYHQLAQLARNFTPLLVPYIAGILLLAVGGNLDRLREGKQIVSLHQSLATEYSKPYYSLVPGWMILSFTAGAPLGSSVGKVIFFKNKEIAYITRSMLVMAVYMTALGILNVVAAAVLLAMVFSSQLAHRLLFRLIWRGGPAVTERIAEGLRTVPLFVSMLIVIVPFMGCGAAGLAVGAVYYAFLISKMYEEYLEDYVYKLMAKVAARVGRLFKFKNREPADVSQETPLLENEEEQKELNNAEEVKAIEGPNESGDSNKSQIVAKQKEGKSKLALNDDKTSDNETKAPANKTDDDNSVKEKEASSGNEQPVEVKEKEASSDDKQLVEVEEKTAEDVVEKGPCDSEESESATAGLHFHLMMFYLWMMVTLINLPVLITWARNYKYQMVLTEDTSFYIGIIMGISSPFIWKIDTPIYKPQGRNSVYMGIIFLTALIVMSFGPQSLDVVNHGVTLVFGLITLQQYSDRREARRAEANRNAPDENKNDETNDSKDEKVDDNVNADEQEEDTLADNDDNNDNNEQPNENGNLIYRMFKNLRDKIAAVENT